MADGSGAQSPVERAFSVALEDLYLRAGEPSSREVARAIGGMSHTTVNQALRGNKIPSWPVVVKLVEYFDGDIEHFRQLWVETRKSTEVTERVETEVSVFVSYARIDDKATYQRISQLVDDIANTYRSMTGQAVGVFQDIDTIKPGDNWKDRIRLGLSSSTILLAFVSPAYLGSANCREELSEFFAFLDANSSDRLIVPLLFADPERIGARFTKDHLWARLSALHRVDISKLRSVDPGSSQWIVKVEEIAEQIDQVLANIEAMPDPSGLEVAHVPSSENEGVIPEGILDRMVSTEEAMPEIQANLLKLGALVEGVGEQTEAATPKMLKADTFAKKLVVSRELACQLDPIAVQITESADRLVLDFKHLNDFVSTILSFTKNSPVETIKDPEAVGGLKAVWEMATTSTASFGQLDDFNQTLGQVIGFSRDLDRPLKSMRGAFLRMADMRGIVKGWLDELQTIQSMHPDILDFTSEEQVKPETR